MFVAGDVTYLPKNASMPVTLKSREYEVFTVVPVKELSNGDSFAPIGMIKMFNSGGAVKELRYVSTKSTIIEARVHGSGTFGAYSSIRPKRISVDSEAVEFTYDEGCGLVTFILGIPLGESYLWNVTIEL